MRGSRLRAWLVKLREDERRRQRSSSLPGYLHSPPFARPFLYGTNVDVRENTGPSCSNNNETYPSLNCPRRLRQNVDRDYRTSRGNFETLCHALRRDYPFERGREEDRLDRRNCCIYDRSRDESDRRGEHCFRKDDELRAREDKVGKRNRDSGGVAVYERIPKKTFCPSKTRGFSSPDGERDRDTSPVGGRKLKISTSDWRSPGAAGARKPSPRCRYIRSKSDRSKRSPRGKSMEDSGVPYMLSQHPYNWTSCNRSGNHYRSISPEGGGYYDEDGVFQPEEDEEHSVVYRKHRPSGFGSSPSIRGASVGSDGRSPRRQQSRISYSNIPASEARYVPLLAADINAGKHNSSRDSWTSVGSGISQPKQRIGSPQKRQSRSASDLISYPGAKRRPSVGNSSWKPAGENGSAFYSSSSPGKGLARGFADCDIYPGMQRSPDKKRVEKNVTFERPDRFDEELGRSANPLPASSQARPSSRTQDIEPFGGKSKPMYYKSLSNQDNHWSWDNEAGENMRFSPCRRVLDIENRFQQDPRPGSPRMSRDQDEYATSRHQSSMPSILAHLPLDSRGNQSLHEAGCFDDPARCYDNDCEEAYVRGLKSFWSRRHCEDTDAVIRSFSPDSLERNLDLEANVATDNISFFSRSSTITNPSPKLLVNADVNIGGMRLPHVDKKPSVSSAPSSFSSVSQQARHRAKAISPGQLDSLPIPNVAKVALNGKKTHRVPTGRSLSPKLTKNHRTKEWIKNTPPICLNRDHNTSQNGPRSIKPRKDRNTTGKDENTNRIEDGSSMTRSDDLTSVTALTPKVAKILTTLPRGDRERRKWEKEVMREEQDKLNNSSLSFLERLLKMDSKMEQLLKEKRELEQRHNDHKQSLSSRRRSLSAPTSRSPAFSGSGDKIDCNPSCAVSSAPAIAATGSWEDNKNSSAKARASPTGKDDLNFFDDIASTGIQKENADKNVLVASPVDLESTVVPHTGLFKKSVQENGKAGEETDLSKTAVYSQDMREALELQECARTARRRRREAELFDSIFSPRDRGSSDIHDLSPKRSRSWEDGKLLQATRFFADDASRYSKTNTLHNPSVSLENVNVFCVSSAPPSPLYGNEHLSSSARRNTNGNFSAAGNNDNGNPVLASPISLRVKSYKPHNNPALSVPLSSTPVSRHSTVCSATSKSSNVENVEREGLRTSDCVKTASTLTTSRRSSNNLKSTPHALSARPVPECISLNSNQKQEVSDWREFAKPSELPIHGKRSPGRCSTDSCFVEYSQRGVKESSEMEPKEAEAAGIVLGKLKTSQTGLQEEVQKCRERRSRMFDMHQGVKSCKESFSKCSSSNHSSSNRSSSSSRLRTAEIVREYMANVHKPISTNVALIAERHCGENKNSNSSCVSASKQFPDDSWKLTAFPQHQLPNACLHRDQDGLYSSDKDVDEAGVKELSNDTRRLLDTMTREAEAHVRRYNDAPLTLLGEVAYQLERRIIRHVFQDPFADLGNYAGSTSSTNADEDNMSVNECDKRHRFYGYTVLNLPEKIRFDCRDPKTGIRDSIKEARLLRRFKSIVSFLKDKFGYHVHKHSRLCQGLIKKYGIFGIPPDVATIARLGLDDFRSLRNHVIKLSNPQDRPELLVLVDCLNTLGQRGDKPILWFH